MKRIIASTLIMLFLMLSIAACGPKTEIFEIRGAQIQGQLTITDGELYEFDGRVSGEANAEFILSSQDEGIGTQSPETYMFCKYIHTLDSSGNADIECTLESRIRQNALILTMPETGYIERIEYRPNVIDSKAEGIAELDYRYEQFGMEPTSAINALKIQRLLTFELPIRGNGYSPVNGDVDVDTSYTANNKGYFLAFLTNQSCYGQFTNNQIVLYKKEAESWSVLPSIPLEDVDFVDQSGSHDFHVEDVTITLQFSNGNKCNDASKILLR